MTQSSSQRSFWMDLMWEMGSMREMSSTVTSGIHCMHAAWHQSPGSVVGFSAPPVTGQRQHCGACWSFSCGQPQRMIHKPSNGAPSQEALRRRLVLLWCATPSEGLQVLGRCAMAGTKTMRSQESMLAPKHGWMTWSERRAEQAGSQPESACATTQRSTAS
jgi:hypothetical protein